jgi:hypothetical protein
MPSRHKPKSRVEVPQAYKSGDACRCADEIFGTLSYIVSFTYIERQGNPGGILLVL